MSQTKAGAAKARQKMIERYGSEEAYKENMRNRARKGGANSNSGGFASTVVGKDGLNGYQRARVAGAVGGTKSRRNKKTLAQK